MNRMFLLIGLGVLFFSASCSNETEKAETVTEAKFQVTSPLKKDTVISADYVCQIKSIRNIELRALEKGYLEHIYVDEGQFVKKGQKMFQILPALYEAEFQKAQAEAQVAEIEYQNTKLLADNNVVSKNELAMVKAKFDIAKSEMKLAQVHLGFTEIRAPFEGIMDRLFVREGSLLDEGALFTSLSDNSKMWVYFNVPEQEYLNYKMHTQQGGQQKVKLRMANNEVFEYTGVVETIEGEFNNETGNIAFRATFQNPKRLLRHGETGNIIMEKPIKNAILIPQKATFEILDKRYVFVIDKEGGVHLTPIEITAEMPDIFVVGKGLAETDMILLEGLRKVKDGVKIQYVYQDPQQVLAHLKVFSE